MTLGIGSRAPPFALEDETGEVRRLRDFRGRALVLYFYPEDDTPACTVQACGYRDAWGGFTAAGVAVVGVSADPPESHRAFKAKHALPFTLLSDPGHRVSAAYGAYGEKTMYGRKVVGTIRSSVIVAPDGRVAGVHRNVRSVPNAARMLAEVRGLGLAEGSAPTAGRRRLSGGT